VNAFALTRRALRALTLAAIPISCAVLPSGATASAAPAWWIDVSSMPSNFAPGAQGSPTAGPRYRIRVINVGEAAADGPIVITDTLPVGLTPGVLDATHDCSAAGQVISCTISRKVVPGDGFQLIHGVDVDPLPDPTVLDPNQVAISSPGAVSRTATATTTASQEAATFGFNSGPSGLGAWLTGPDGEAVAAAGGRPSQLTVNLGFRTKPGSAGSAGTTLLPSGGGARDVRVALPPGLVYNPSAVPLRCTEEQFVTNTCLDAATIGRANVSLGIGNLVGSSNTPVVALIPPPGAAASFGFDPGGSGLFEHVIGGLRPGDYAVTGTVEDLPALFENPLYGVQLQLWGDPSNSSHDSMRGACEDLCPVPPLDFAALSAPTSCLSSLPIEAEMDSWGDPGKFVPESAPFTDLDGHPTGIVGCQSVPFEPTLGVQPTTNLSDSPTGLDIDLGIPQSESLATTATAHLKRVVVTLPEGLVIDPASGGHLVGCSAAEIGIDPANGLADEEPAHCPLASRIGSVVAESSLLAEYDANNEVQRDGPEQVLAHPVPGSIYLATPHENPFGSQLAIYVVLHEPRYGIVVKLAGKVRADPQTGRLTTTFADLPQLPFESLQLKFSGGSSAVLRTSIGCGTMTSTSTLVPWSAPDGPDSSSSDSFEISAAPGGGRCPLSDAAAANDPAFSAGTVDPRAGAYSPFVLKLSRASGSASIATIEATLPPGLIGSLAGLSYCPDPALAAAKSGIDEKRSPSCPTSSEIGTVTVGVGAGAAPHYIQGRAYLSGPYEGAPLSAALIVPAVAGPFDLGTMVSRGSVHVDPETTSLHVAFDPIPSLLQGIPLDVRSVALRLDRSDFSLNPTSCDPMEIIATAISPAGSPASLTSPFQVGGCRRLPFKPRFALGLSGGAGRGQHPALRATLISRPTEANLAGVAFTLPSSEFFDLEHVKAICGRDQFAASRCPPGSIYGHATVTTPLSAAPLTGPVYLRSSGDLLPDLVVDLSGSIRLTLVGHVDSEHGGIRTSFPRIPDIPVSKFVLSMLGGKKGLLENGDDLCKGRDPKRASVRMDGQNGKAFSVALVPQAACARGKRAKRTAR
jgi:hypothetical protein